ncbi:hypothetical protein CONPUDRAFT_76310 [Coniophora puteana RWD-64-598 SS2]|uniref:Fungal-type protein kinase domain-containing protein n=1 Tax=Coniophora puteana (strain RWD-64-598) TaxID=741705 RepID=A0A5M3MBU6_CONPW|nr:uncharacterized protein CONPUDRAFT_76310 [Coniophora puteana RWD-64-598 SS2]EIW76702.1 hypothetical protein CONPUDRAFT_76310 [Coniophora puteana RWD-64-598 SS2]
MGDNTCVGVTEVLALFSWTATAYLQESTWRLYHTEDARRHGHDTTLVPLKPMVTTELEQPAKCQDSRRMIPFTKSLSTVRREESSDPLLSPNRHGYPMGCGTRCFVAYDHNDGVKPRLVLLKDFWRVASDRRESDVYAKLKTEGVPYIYDAVIAGDVPGKLQECGADRNGLHRLVHFRVVPSRLGRPITTFASTWQLVKALSCAFKAHHQAFKKARSLHRDVSVGNILIDTSTGDGYLIDWHIAKSIDDEAPRTHERTESKGTLQFRSGRLLDPDLEPGEALHKVTDDIESFVQVLLWITLRYVKSGLHFQSRKTFLAYFDSESVAVSKMMLLTNPNAPLSLLSSPHFKSLLLGLQFHAGLHRAGEDYLPMLREVCADLDQRIERMNTHDWMEDYLDKCLANEEWKSTTHDGSEDQMPTLATKREREEVNRNSQEPK